MEQVPDDELATFMQRAWGLAGEDGVECGAATGEQQAKEEGSRKGKAIRPVDPSSETEMPSPTPEPRV